MILWLPLAGLLLYATGCQTMPSRQRDWERQARRSGAPTVHTFEITGYCHCGACCNWQRNWRAQPVVRSGIHRGKPKAVGITASGVRAGYGTIAADKTLFPFGTLMYVPGYGYGRVEDTGGAIKGYRLDLFFPSHDEALRWGRVRKKVYVWK